MTEVRFSKVWDIVLDHKYMGETKEQILDYLEEKEGLTKSELREVEDVYDETVWED